MIAMVEKFFVFSTNLLAVFAPNRMTLVNLPAVDDERRTAHHLCSLGQWLVSTITVSAGRWRPPTHAKPLNTADKKLALIQVNGKRYATFFYYLHCIQT